MLTGKVLCRLDQRPLVAGASCLVALVSRWVGHAGVLLAPKDSLVYGDLRRAPIYQPFHLSAVATRQLRTLAEANSRLCSGDQGARVEVFAGTHPTVGAVFSNSL